MSFLNTVFDHLRKEPARPALLEIRGAEVVPTTGRELLAQVGVLRAGLRSVGVEAGDRVALLGPNGAAWVAADLAILAEGAVCVPLYDRQAPEELAVMLEDCGASLVVALRPELRDALLEAWPHPDRVHLAAELAEGKAGNSGTASASNSAGLQSPKSAGVADATGVADASPAAAPSPAAGDEATAPAPVDEAPFAWEGDALMTLIYTSGTSGVPKGVRLVADGIAFMLDTTRQHLEGATGRSTPNDRVFHYLPFCFAGSRVLLWTCLLRGNPLHLSTDLTQLVSEIQVARPNYFLNVPVLLERIRSGVGEKVCARGSLFRAAWHASARALADPDAATPVDRAALALLRRLVFPRIRQQIGPALEFLICGSAPLSETTQRWFGALGVPVLQVYGLTETTAIVTMDRPDALRPGWVGSPIEGAEVRIDGEGELLVRGPMVFPGYWERPDADAEAFAQEGWFRTGDLAEQDAEGRLRIIGRAGNVLVPESGHNVPPEPLEERLREAFPAAEQIVVIGHGRPYLCAIVTGESGDEASRSAALETVNAALPHYRRIRKILPVAEPFTPESGLVTANQKLRRRAIAAHFVDAIEELYR